MEIKQAPVESLIPYARNARTHSDAQVAQIASLAFQAPSTSTPEPEPETPRQTAQEPSQRDAMVKAVLDYPGDWRRIAGLVVDTHGPDAFSDKALAAIARIIDAISARAEQ